ncbi:hypothetical protein ACHAQD_011013 [Fusarium lateritium]
MYSANVLDKDTYNIREWQQNPMQNVAHYLRYFYGCWCYSKSPALRFMTLDVARCRGHAVVGRPFRIGNEHCAFVETIQGRRLKVNLTLTSMESIGAIYDPKLGKY